MKKHKQKKQHAKSSRTQAQNRNQTLNQRMPRATFFRRLLAMVYDTLVATAVGMCAAIVLIVTLVVLLKNGVLNLQGYAEPADLIQASFGYKLVIQLWVGAWIAGFFLWFWKKGGQTLGMRAWRLRIYSSSDAPMTWGRLVLRLICSLGGLGTLLVLFDFKNKQSLQDRVADTEVLFLTKEANHHKNW